MPKLKYSTVLVGFAMASGLALLLASTIGQVANMDSAVPPEPVSTSTNVLTTPSQPDNNEPLDKQQPTVLRSYADWSQETHPQKLPK